MKRIDESAINNFTTLRELLGKRDEQIHALKEWQKTMKEDMGKTELQNRIMTAEKNMSDNFSRLLEKIDEKRNCKSCKDDDR